MYISCAPHNVRSISIETKEYTCNEKTFWCTTIKIVDELEVEMCIAVNGDTLEAVTPTFNKELNHDHV